MLLIGKPSISMGHGFHGELLNSQRVAHRKNIDPQMLGMRIVSSLTGGCSTTR